ncbi:MAG: hypothetical protein AAF307_02765 [Pseudomonadota bacterium]
MYGLAGLLIGGIALAVYERRKGLEWPVDDGPETGRDPKRRADVNSERMRTEGVFLNDISGGGPP